MHGALSLRVWSMLCGALAATAYPSSPFSIEAYGAVAGVDTHEQALANGVAFASAVFAANATADASHRGVLIPAGRVYSFLPATTGFNGVHDLTVFLEGTLNVSTANFSTSYPGFPNPWTPIYFGNAARLTIVSETGKGLLNGRGNEWWWYTILVADHRSNLLTIARCTDCLIEGISLLNSPQYHFGLWDQQNLVVRRVTVMVDILDQLDILAYMGGAPVGASALEVLRAAGPHRGTPKVTSAAAAGEMARARALRLPTSRFGNRPWWRASWTEDPPVPMIWALNTDGIDFSGRNISVYNCSVTNFDDSVCVKPLVQSDAGYCTSDVEIHDVSVTWGVGVSMGSVPPNVGNNCIDRVSVRRVHFTTPLKAIYVKPNPPKSAPATGSITNILYEDITVDTPVWWAIWIGPQQQQQPGSTGTGCSFLFPINGTTCATDPEVTVANITLRRVTVTDAVLSPGILLMNSTNPGRNWTFDAVVFTNYSSWPVPEGYMCENVQGKATGGTSPVPPCFA